MPSWRIEHLTLVKPDGKRVALSRVGREPGDVTTQDVFQVSPDGAVLAYVAADGAHVRTVDGADRALRGYHALSLMRFSPDAKYLAIVTGKTGSQRVAVLELASNKTRELATFTNVRQLEWIRDGLVVNTQKARSVLVHLRLDGTVRTLLEHEHIARFITAVNGTRVVAFVRKSGQTHALSFDAATPRNLVALAAVDGSITNAAASLAGERVAFTTQNRVFLAIGTALAQAISDREDVHSLWFSRDGRLGYASAQSATIVDGKRTRRFEVPAEGAIHMLRFDPVSGQALVTTDEHVWDAMTAQRVTIATEATSLLGVDRFRGGVILWTTDG